MNFTIQQLKIFLEIAFHNNITKAASEMYMTQPALSMQLKKFQKQFDLPLTEKIGKKLYLTDFGKSIAEIAEKVIKDLDEIKYKTKEYEGLLTGKLRISSASTGKYVIPYFLSGFIKKYNGIDLSLDVSNKRKVIKSLQNNEVDFALVSVVPEGLEAEEEILLENKLFLVNSELKVGKDKPLIFREEGSATRNSMFKYFKNHEKRKSIELTSNEAVKQALIADLGYSIIPLIGIKKELKSKELYIVNSKGLPIISYWRLIWLKNKQLSPVAEAYLNFIRESKEKIIKEKFAWYNNY